MCDVPLTLTEKQRAQRERTKWQRRKSDRIVPTKMIKGVLVFRSLFVLFPSFTLVCARALFPSVYFSFFPLIPKRK